MRETSKDELAWAWIHLVSAQSWNNPVEVPLNATGETTLLLDFDPRGNHPTFLEPDTPYSIGGTSGIPEEHFDGMIYLEVAPAMDPLFNATPCP